MRLLGIDETAGLLLMVLAATTCARAQTVEAAQGKGTDSTLPQTVRMTAPGPGPGGECEDQEREKNG
jgi:hypothetical protein